ncbi:MFS transporter [Paenarthrobacter sp. AMU7]|uniref:Putative proline/betaine transporter n=1 Tax=Paenarthrobacter sp. AMU7 TaxID=3162492 RepID=A0AB39YM54_9MICC
MSISTPPPTAASVRVDQAKMKKIAFASVIGTTVEWYDLFLFGTASALVFNKIFFPSFDPVVGTLLAFGTFAAAYLARTLGAIIFGHFGDRVGRKSMLLVSLITMGAATFAIGLVPDYNTIGVWAPLFLLILRVIQGLALGGEWGGAVLMTVEHAPSNRRGFFGSLVQIGVPAGTLMANLAFLAVVASVSQDALISWGWRIPFLASAILVVVGIYIRLNIEETPSFQAVKDAGAKAKLPFTTLMREHWKQVLLGALATMSTGSTFTLITASAVAYGKKDLGHSDTTMLLAVMVSCALCFVLIPMFGRLSDSFGRKPIIIAGVAAEALLAFPMFWLMDTKSVALLFIAYIAMMCAFAAHYGPLATFLAELFGSKVRYSGLSVAYMLSGLLGSATTPFITTWLLGVTHQSSSVAWFALITASISLVALLVLTETRKGNIDVVTGSPADARVSAAEAS